jgi:hypothetical protein
MPVPYFCSVTFNLDKGQLQLYSTNMGHANEAFLLPRRCLQGYSLRALSTDIFPLYQQFRCLRALKGFVLYCKRYLS